jgi:hypothetical protein
MQNDLVHGVVGMSLAQVDLSNLEIIARKPFFSLFKAYAQKTEGALAVAVKFHDFEKIQNPQVAEVIRQGSSIHYSLDHPHIVKALGYCDHGDTHRFEFGLGIFYT